MVLPPAAPPVMVAAVHVVAAAGVGEFTSPAGKVSLIDIPLSVPVTLGLVMVSVRVDG